MSLTFRLLLLVFVALLPTFALQAYNEFVVREARTQEVNDLALRQAELAASELDRILAASRSLLVAVIQTPATSSSEPAACTSYFDALTRAVPGLAGLLTTDGEGHVRCRSAAIKAGNVSELKLGKPRTAGDDLLVGLYDPSAIAGRPVLPIGLPLDASGKAQAVAVLDLKWLAEEFRRRGYPEGGSITIADTEGTIIVREPESFRFTGTPIIEPFRYLLKEPKPGAASIVSRDKVARILGYVPPDTRVPGLFVATGLAQSSAFAMVDAATRRGGFLVLIGLAFSLAAAWVAGHSFITLPMHTILETAEAWRSGELSARTGMRARDGEIGRIGQEFDRVVADLQNREMKLRRSEERLRLALEATKLGIWDVNRLTGQRKWSGEFLAILGLPPGTVPDSGAFADLIHPEDRTRVMSEYERAYQPGSNGSYETEFRILRADTGAERWLAATGQVTFDRHGKPLRGTGTIRDITARKRADDRIRDSEARLHALADNLPHGMVYQMYEGRDGRNQLLFVSRGITALLGITVEEAMADTQRFYQLVDPAWRERMHRAENEARDRLELFQFEVPIRTRDGAFKWIQISSRPAVAPRGGWVWDGLATDITERREREERIGLLMREVSHRVKNQYAIILAMARQTGRQALSIENFQAMFVDRLQGLSRSHDLLVQGDWSGASIRELLRAQLSSFASLDDHRISIEGPDVLLRPEAVQALGMAFHELGTNATKYGALATSKGKLHVAWWLEGSGPEEGTFHLVWSEQGGPAVVPTASRGFGREVVERLSPASLDGRAELHFTATGIRWVFSAPQSGLLSGERPGEAAEQRGAA